MKFSGTEPTYMKLLIEKLKDVGIDSASRNTFNNFMLFLPEMLKSAYTKKNIEFGWVNSGLYPFDIGKILQKTPYYNEDLSSENRSMIISAIPKLSDFARENGEIADKEIISEINFIYTGDSADNRNYETCPLNYKRAVWVNHEKITAIHKIRQEEKRKKAIEDAAKKNESKNKASK
jgi:hypothetical protein